jgi:Arc/MetJ-type ribon-helix-helix transcriptional regulator
MTRKLSISLPDDIAEQLDHVENASAYIAEAIRLCRSRERTREMLERHGVHVTDDGVAAMGDRLRALRERRRQGGGEERAA